MGTAKPALAPLLASVQIAIQRRAKPSAKAIFIVEGSKPTVGRQMKTLVNFTVTEASEGWAVRYIIPNTPWYPQHGFGTTIIVAMQDATKRDGDEAFTLLMNAWRERYGDAGEGGMVRMRRQAGEWHEALRLRIPARSKRAHAASWRLA